ncbi:hypothetical protein D5S17_32955 [Pseudonocardiaceae bacterium YIM PH 21723]|nr:hypothetical protein D5S17_32955 [Pseudonocardiaceae bacterium YIM PH 21723]
METSSGPAIAARDYVRVDAPDTPEALPRSAVAELLRRQGIGPRGAISLRQASRDSGLALETIRRLESSTAEQVISTPWETLQNLIGLAEITDEQLKSAYLIDASTTIGAGAQGGDVAGVLAQLDQLSPGDLAKVMSEVAHRLANFHRP